MGRIAIFKVILESKALALAKAPKAEALAKVPKAEALDSRTKLIKS